MTFTYQVLVILFTIASGIIISQYGAINMLITSSALSMCTTLLYIFIKIPEDNRGFDGINIKEVFYEYKQELYKGSLFIKNSFIPKFLMGSIIANFLLWAVTANLPSYAAYRGSEAYYAYFLAAISEGLLIGSLIANILRKFDLGKLTIIGFFISGVFWLIAVYTSNLYVSIMSEKNKL